MIAGIFGNVGDGKTLLATLMGLNTAETGKQVYSNYRIRDNRVQLIDVDRFIDMNEEFESLTILDEIYVWLDSRCSASQQNRAIGNVVLQSRKRGIDILFTSQLPSSVDKRLRYLSNIQIIAMKRMVEKFRYCFVTPWARRTFTLPLEKAKRIFPRYDTKEIVSL